MTAKNDTEKPEDVAEVKTDEAIAIEAENVVLREENEALKNAMAEKVVETAKEEVKKQEIAKAEKPPSLIKQLEVAREIATKESETTESKIKALVAADARKGK